MRIACLAAAFLASGCGLLLDTDPLDLPPGVDAGEPFDSGPPDPNDGGGVDGAGPGDGGGGGVDGAIARSCVPAIDEVCNGADDDCDGNVDEELPDITCGLGPCQVTQLSCVGGRPATCTPRPGADHEVCTDGVDNDCDGATDQGCGEQCVFVSRGVAVSGPMPTNPLMAVRSIGEALRYIQNTPDAPHRICVSAGVTCAGPRHDYPEDLTMMNGVHVIGGFNDLFGPCRGLRTRLAPETHSDSVYFPETVTEPTELVSFEIGRHPTAPITTGVHVTGTGAILADVWVTGGRNITSTTGVLVDGTGFVRVYRSIIQSGEGPEAVAIHIGAGTGATGQGGADIRENCGVFDAQGRCLRCSGLAAREPGIYGRSTAGAAGPGIGVRVGQGHVILDGNSVCSENATEATGVLVEGQDSRLLATRNHIVAHGSVDAIGIELDGCQSTVSRIAGNHTVAAGAATSFGIYAGSGCPAFIEWNANIYGAHGIGTTGTSLQEAHAVLCEGADCFLSHNPDIRGSGNDSSVYAATGVECQASDCRVEACTISGGTASSVVGVDLYGGAPLFRGNDIFGGCGETGQVVTGASLQYSDARFESNVINATGGCVTGTSNRAETLIGVHLSGDGSVFPTLHSNTIATSTSNSTDTNACRAADVVFEGPVGALRNNILVPGACVETYWIKEVEIGSSPTLLEHNDFAPAPPGVRAWYLDDGSNSLPAPLNDGNTDGDPAFVGAADYHLGANSACDGTGTVEDAPATDHDGVARGNPPDIGAYERP